MEEADEELGRFRLARDRDDELALVLFVLGVAGEPAQSGRLAELEVERPEAGLTRSERPCRDGDLGEAETVALGA